METTSKEWVIKALGGEGILEPEDIPDLQTQRGRVLRYMLDRRWKWGSDILRVSGGSEGLRRLRELRKIPGVDIEVRRADTPGRVRAFQYRMVF